MQQRSTFKDLLTVLSGTAGAQLLGVLILPFLSRVFAPEAFGAFQLYISVLVFFSIGATLRIEIALLSKREDELEGNLRQLFGLTTCTATAVTVALALFDWRVRPLGFPVLLLGLGLFGNGATQIVSYRLIRLQNFRRLATLKFVQVLVYSAAAVTIALIAPRWWGIIAADVGGRLAAASLALVWMRNADRSGERIFQFRDISGFVRRHWELAIISLPGAMANSAGVMLTPILVFQVFGAAAAGQYGLVDRAMGVPVAMLVTAGSQVFSARLVSHLEAGEAAQARRLFARVAAAGLALSVVSSVIGYWLLPLVFGRVFGAGWGLALKIAQVMIFAYAVMLVSGLVNQTLVALRAYRLQSSWDFCWPLTIGCAWIAVVRLHLNLLTAITLHALSVSGLALVFLALALMKIQSTSPNTRGDES